MPARIRIPVIRQPHAVGLDLPSYATFGSAGLDLCAAIDQDMTLAPLERRLIPTGLVLQIPEGFEGQVRSRSGQALHRGLTVANAPGTIDSDYRGEVGVILINLSHEPQTVKRGEAIAQLVIAPVMQADFEEVESVSKTERGAGGFGHTGS
jgi:dUTP pyrophosphatase